jgi:hypothetical protein
MKNKYATSARCIQMEYYRAKTQSRSSTAFSSHYWEGYLLGISKAKQGILLSEDTELKNILLMENSPHINEQQKAVGLHDAIAFCTVKRQRGRAFIGNYFLEAICISEQLYNDLMEVAKETPNKSLGDIRRLFLRQGIAIRQAELKQLKQQDLSAQH